jgi:hypothetical protein
VSLCVVAFPLLLEADRNWLQSIRARYDPQFELIAPHVTVLFPSTSLDLTELVGHVRGVAQVTEPFEIVFRCVLPYRGLHDKRTHLFLMPDEGLSHVVGLHDQLQRHTFENRLRSDVPFIPQLTVGAFDDGADCRRVADEINIDTFMISGQVRTLSIVSGSGPAIIHREIALGDGN